MSDLNAYYEGAALWDSEKYLSGYERQRLAAAVGLVPATCKTLVDIGCGNGAFLAAAEQRHPGIAMTGCDPSGTAIGKKWCRAEIFQSAGTDLPYADRSFDVVCSMAVLEHVRPASLARSVGEIARLSDRYILLNLPWRERRARVRCPSCGCGFDPHLHLRSYDDAAIAALFPGFVERQRLVMAGREMIIPYVIQNVLGQEFSAARYPNTICPQCGVAAPAPAGPAAAAPPGWRRQLWQRQPALKIEREIFLLFERV